MKRKKKTGRHFEKKQKWIKLNDEWWPGINSSSISMHTRTLSTTVPSFLFYKPVSSFPQFGGCGCSESQVDRDRPRHSAGEKWSSASPSSVTRWVPSLTFRFCISSTSPEKMDRLLISDLNSNSDFLWIFLLFSGFVSPMSAEQSAVHTELHGGRWCSQAPPHRPLLARCGRRARCVYYEIVLISVT